MTGIVYRRLTLLFPGILVAVFGFPSSAGADVCADPYDDIAAGAPAATINLVGQDGGAGICDTCLTDAGNAWDNKCDSGQSPRFETGGSGGISVPVGFHSGANPGSIPNCSSDKCACTSTMIQDGKIVGATVDVFQSAAGTPNCQAEWTPILTHELGHVLGLEDAPACSNRIMGNVDAGINDNDCSSVDGNFISGPELTANPPDGHPCSNPRV